jgi:hypothetical protein
MSHTRDEADGDQRDASVSRIYQRTAARTAPQALDRRVLAAARKAHSGSQYLAALAFAASVLLSVAVVLAIAFGPRAARHAEEPVRVLRAAVRAGSPPSAGAPRAALKADRGPAHVRGTDLAPPLLGKRQLYTSDPPARDPQRWLAAIAALRKAGREPEAEAEYRRFRTAYPDFVTASEAPTGP